ncbi:hypothetical protein GQ457_11G031070 [Hibiscus cannabinus]
MDPTSAHQRPVFLFISLGQPPLSPPYLLSYIPRALIGRTKIESDVAPFPAFIHKPLFPPISLLLLLLLFPILLCSFSFFPTAFEISLLFRRIRCSEEWFWFARELF